MINVKALNLKIQPIMLYCIQCTVGTSSTVELCMWPLVILTRNQII